MLSYAFTTLRQGAYEDIAAEKFDNIHNLFAAILAKGISVQIRQGLYREYLNHRESTSSIRGKIILHESIQNIISRQRILTCEYDELSENNLLNQIIKTTVILLLQHPDVDSKYKDSLKKEMLFFSNVGMVNPGTIQCSSIQFNRYSVTYRLLIGLCQFILKGLLLTTETGQYRMSTFIDEQRICRLYERFLLEYYIKECPHITTNSSQISWVLDDEVRHMLPIMQSDIMLSKGNEVLIIEAKYYSKTMQTRHDIKSVYSNHLYQLFTYVKNKTYEFKEGCHNVSDLLLYAATDEAIQPNSSYQMSGNKISVRTLDLNRPFSEISAQLNAIVEEHFSGV